MARKIVMKIDPKTGNCTVAPEGYTGDDCQKATKGLVDGLGMTGSCELTPDYYKASDETQQKVGGPSE